MPILIEHIAAEPRDVVTISLDESLEKAVAVMIENDFSQLPVVDNGKPYGKPASFVTSNSIAHALKVCKAKLFDLKVKDAIEPARTVTIDEDLFNKMDDLMESFAVLVLNSDGSIASIVTNYDTTHYFRVRAEDMLLIEDIETTLKDHIRSAYGGDETDPSGPLQTAINALSSFTDTIYDECKKQLFKFCSNKSVQLSNDDIEQVLDKPFAKARGERKFDDLTLNEYIQLARRPEAWKVLEISFQISEDAFREMLEGTRRTRNKLMHFRPDITEEERKDLRFCAEWFNNHPAILAEIDTVAETTPTADSPGNDDGNGTDDELSRLETYATEELEGDTNEENLIESKYAPLANYLLSLPRNKKQLIASFAEIENIIGSELPRTAREHRSWWANDSVSHVQSKHWLSVNWRVVSTDLSNEKVVFARALGRERAYIEFFSKVQSRLREKENFPLVIVNPTGRNWLTLARFNQGKQRLIVSFAQRHRLRLEVYIDTGDKAENKLIFDQLLLNKFLIEQDFAHSLEWERLDHRIGSRVAIYKDAGITDSREHLRYMVDWISEAAPSMFLAFEKRLEIISHEISQRNSTGDSLEPM